MLKSFNASELDKAITAARKLVTTPTVFQHKQTGILYVTDSPADMQSDPDTFSIAWQEAAKKLAAYTQGEKEHLLMTVFEALPKTERTMLKHCREYAFEMLNDTGDPCLYRVLVNGKEVGAVRYYRGRKLCPMVALFEI